MDLVGDELFATSYAFLHSRQEKASRVDYIPYKYTYEYIPTEGGLLSLLVLSSISNKEDK